MNSFWSGFIKKADKEKSERDKNIGLASTAGGAYAMHKAKPLVTGRTTLYHGTSSAGAKKIKEEGLKSGRFGISGILDPKLNANKHVYLTPSYMTARGYATQADSLSKLKDVKDYNPIQRVMDWAVPVRGKVLKANAPLWHPSLKDKMVANPELKGAKSWKEYHQNRPKSNFDPRPEFAKRQESKSLFGSLHRTKTFKESFPNKYIKGSKNYKRLSLGEMKEYIKHKPGHFAGGAALGAAGLAGVVHGVNKLRQSRAKQ